MTRKRPGTGGFTFLELLVSLSVLSVLSVTAALMLTPQISYFRLRGNAQKILYLLRDQQAQAARAGYQNGSGGAIGGRGGGLVFYRGHVIRRGGSITLESVGADDTFSFMPCPVDYGTSPPRVSFPSSSTLSGLTPAELAGIVNITEGILYRNRTADIRVQSGDYILFAEADLLQTASTSFIRMDDPLAATVAGTPVDRGSAIFSASFGSNRQVVVAGFDASDGVFSIEIDPGGFIRGRKQ